MVRRCVCEYVFTKLTLLTSVLLDTDVMYTFNSTDAISLIVIKYYLGVAPTSVVLDPLLQYSGDMCTNSAAADASL